MIERQERARICVEEKRDKLSYQQVFALLYPGRQLIGCESLIGCEPSRDRVDQPDFRRYISVQFIHSS